MLNYNFSHNCVYYDLHAICELDIAHKKKNGVQNNELIENRAFVDTSYQIDILSIFCVPDTGSDKDIERASVELDNLYLHIQSNKTCQELMLLAASTLDSVDLKTGLIVLYSFQYMNFVHNIMAALKNIKGAEDIPLFNLCDNNALINNGLFDQVELLKEMLRKG